MAYEEPKPRGDRALLRIDAQIISNDDGFIIEITNSEKKETIRVDNVRDYAEYLIESVNNSLCDDFVANWLPSPKAKRADIDLIGMQLGMMQEWMDKELKLSNEDNGFS
jgi:hypothetical protein